MEYQLIGSGRYSDVFDFNGYVLKLYKKCMENGSVEKEYYFSKLAYDNKILTAEPKSIICEENRKGIIFQKINGQTLLNIIISNPIKIKKLLKNFVKLQSQIHSIELNNCKYTVKDHLRGSIKRNDQIENDDKDLIQEYIKKLPDGNSLCHGDFHPENVIFDNNEYYVIDWMTGMQGSIAADVARTEMILKNADIPGIKPKAIKLILQIFQKIFSKMYIKGYCKISMLKRKDINIWKLPLYIARLEENNSKEEENRLLKYIEKGIKKQKTSA